MRGARLILGSGVLGFAAGYAVVAATLLVSAYGPTSPDGGWSLRGNGAVVVPVALGPTVLTMGWTALAQRWRHARSLLFTGGAGLVQLVLGCLVFVLPPELLLPGLAVVLGWPVVAAALASRSPQAVRADRPLRWTLLAMVALTLGMILPFLLTVLFASRAG